MSQTFHLSRPSHLLMKLKIDVLRIDTAQNSAEAIYAALDCANCAWHMVDWVLASSTDDEQRELCGKLHKEHGATDAFVDRHLGALPKLETCRLISNSGKHLVLRKPNSSVVTTSSVTYDPPLISGKYWSGEMRHNLTIEDASGSYSARDFFSAARADWEAFLPTIGF